MDLSQSPCVMNFLKLPNSSFFRLIVASISDECLPLVHWYWHAFSKNEHELWWCKEMDCEFDPQYPTKCQDWFEDGGCCCRNPTSKNVSYSWVIYHIIMAQKHTSTRKGFICVEEMLMWCHVLCETPNYDPSIGMTIIQIINLRLSLVSD